jgi:hypothetical protein
MKNITDTINRYVTAWNDKTFEAIEAAFSECCTQQITYTDKNASTYTDSGEKVINGIQRLTALVMSSHEKVPGRTFSMLTTPQYFDGHCHYSWGLHIPGKDVMAGWDYIQYNEDGLITKIIGFLPEQP